MNGLGCLTFWVLTHCLSESILAEMIICLLFHPCNNDLIIEASVSFYSPSLRPVCCYNDKNLVGYYICPISRRNLKFVFFLHIPTLPETPLERGHGQGQPLSTVTLEQLGLSALLKGTYIFHLVGSGIQTSDLSVIGPTL